MYTGRTLFSQVMDFVPWTSFNRIVAKYRGDRDTRTLRCTEHFRVMAFAQVTYRESLRDIEACLGARPAKLCSMGLRGPVAKSTMADANESWCGCSAPSRRQWLPNRIDRLLDGTATLPGLLDATERRYAELGQPHPPAMRRGHRPALRASRRTNGRGAAASDWSRLTWPALARRHAAPWSRKISATSSTGRDMTAGRYAGGFLLFLGFLRGCDSRSRGLSMPAIMPVATRV
jgi:Domain of unknown function (DUF4372)